MQSPRTKSFLHPNSVAATILTWAIFGSASAAGPSFPKVQKWTGSGPLRAAIIVDWAEGNSRPPLAWGYRYSISATSEEMLLAVAQSDPRLYFRLGNSGSFGISVYGIGYDRDGDGFGLSDGTQFTDGVAYTGPSDGTSAVDPDDSYQEGWFDGYWGYFQRNSLLDGCQPQWNESGNGVSGHTLQHGDWDGFRFSDSAPLPPELPPTAYCRQWEETISIAAAGPAVVPEPSVWLIGIVLSGLSCILFRRRAVVATGLLASLAFFPSVAPASDFASQIVSYVPGSGLNGSFDNPQAAVGSPTRITSPSSPFGGPVTPFQSPFGADELVSIGYGGELVLAFDRPVLDRPTSDLFGADLIVFGNAFFFDADYPNGVVGGIGEEPGLIEVSQDGLAWMAVQQMADTAFPTMGYQDVLTAFPMEPGNVPSNFLRPVDPSLDPQGLTMAQLVAAYQGSGGGVSVDIAQTGLPWIQFIRFTNQNDPSSGITPEIDAVSIVPEPSVLIGVFVSAILLPLSFRRSLVCG